METVSVSSSSASGSMDMDVATAVETGQPVATVKSFKDAAGVPWWQQRRVLISLSLTLLAGACAAGGVAVMAFLDEGGNGSSSVSSSDSDGSINGIVTLPPVQSPQPPPATASPTQAPPTAPPTQATLAPTTAPPTASPTTTSPTLSPTSDGIQNAFSFFVMGDIPYDEEQAQVLEEQIAEMNTNVTEDAVFTVHVGDMMKSDISLCRAEYFELVANMLLKGPHPTLVIAGDNDFLDCDDQELGWDNYYEYFVDKPFEQNWLNSTDRTVPYQFDVTRNFPNKEMFSFVYEGVLFISVSFWQNDQRYMGESIDWVTERVETSFEQEDIRGVVIFGHSQRNGDNRPFFEGIMPLFFDHLKKKYTRRVPVLYIHGDGHDWKIDRRFQNSFEWSLFWDICVDQGYRAPPILVQVAPGLANGSFVPLEAGKSRQYVFGKGLFRIDRRGGKYRNVFG